MKSLVEAKANMQARNNGTGCVPLHDAAKEGNFPAVKQLLEMGAPHLPRSTFGELPTDYAKEGGHTQIVEFLGKSLGRRENNFRTVAYSIILIPEAYTPLPATVYQFQWYHGTLDRIESNQILKKFATTLELKDPKVELDAAEGHTEDDSSNTEPPVKISVSSIVTFNP